MCCSAGILLSVKNQIFPNLVKRVFFLNNFNLELLATRKVSLPYIANYASEFVRGFHSMKLTHCSTYVTLKV